jgi:hypothetical protein
MGHDGVDVVDRSRNGSRAKEISFEDYGSIGPIEL